MTERIINDLADQYTPPNEGEIVHPEALLCTIATTHTASMANGSRFPHAASKRFWSWRTG
jgi:hypothetical protein